MQRLLVSALFLLSTLPARGDGHLIVLVSVDQVRQDYLNRFADDLTAGGFRMFAERGAVFTNATFDYASTETGPGHATIGTGAYGNAHGIVGNNWYDRHAHRSVYCVEDSSVRLVGATGAGRSPRWLIGSTIADELRAGSGFHSKAFSISWKDRAAILIGGALVNGAFWMVDSTVVTSSYYMQSLPEWAERFNASGRINSFFGAVWDRALPESHYRRLDRDDAPYETSTHGLGRTFPRRIDGGTPGSITPSYYSALRASPFANKLIIELALAALEAEELGQRGVTDLLAVSLSATDYAGHAFGPHSHEVLDLLVRADSLLGRFWEELDARVGLEHCTIALTADHGIAPIPEYITANAPGAAAGRVHPGELRSRLNARLSLLVPPRPEAQRWIERVEGGDLYLDSTSVSEAGLSVDAATRVLADALESFDEVYAVYTRADILQSPASSPVHRRVQNSFYRERSGDLVVVLKPFLLGSSSPTGTSHGSPYLYDSHVPLLLAGPGIRTGTYNSVASPADIAPTLATVLSIELPSQHTGRVLVEAIEHAEKSRPAGER